MHSFGVQQVHRGQEHKSALLRSLILSKSPHTVKEFHVLDGFIENRRRTHDICRSVQKKLSDCRRGWNIQNQQGRNTKTIKDNAINSAKVKPGQKEESAYNEPLIEESQVIMIILLQGKEKNHGQEYPSYNNL